jgi:hypothetical protein
MHATWRILDPDADPLTRPAPALLIKLHEEKGRSEIWRHSWTGQDPESPDLDVIATGILRKAEHDSAYYDDFLLEDASICRVKRDPNHPQKPLHHPLDNDGWDDLLDCGNL